MKRMMFALAFASLFLAAPLSAAPRVDITIAGEVVDLTASEAPVAQVLQHLAAKAGFSVDGLETLPVRAVAVHLHGSLEQVIDGLLDAASRIATYGGPDGKHLSRLVLLPTGPDQPQQRVAIGSAQPPDLPADDPAVGASRMGASALQAGIASTLGIRLP